LAGTPRRLKAVLRPGKGPHVTAYIVDLDSSLSGVPACLLEKYRRHVETRDVDSPLRQTVGNSAVTACQVKNFHSRL